MRFIAFVASDRAHKQVKRENIKPLYDTEVLFNIQNCLGAMSDSLYPSADAFTLIEYNPGSIVCPIFHVDINRPLELVVPLNVIIRIFEEFVISPSILTFGTTCEFDEFLTVIKKFWVSPTGIPSTSAMLPTNFVVSLTGGVTVLLAMVGNDVMLFGIIFRAPITFK